jgi:ATP-dependent RNA helicase RhlE
MNFEQFNLDSRLMQGIKDAGYETATPIQEAAIPSRPARTRHHRHRADRHRQDRRVHPPHFQQVTRWSQIMARALIVTPTRELAEQIYQVTKNLSAGTGLRSATIYGGVGADRQDQGIAQGVEILVAMPGPPVGPHPAETRKNESHRDPGARRSRPHVRHGLSARRANASSKPCLKNGRRCCSRRPSRPRWNPRVTVADRAAKDRDGHQQTRIHGDARVVSRAAAFEIGAFDQTAQADRDTDSVLVFTRTKHRADKVARQIAHAGFRVTSLHSNRTQGQRETPCSGFKIGTLPDHGRHRHRGARSRCRGHLARHQLRHARHRRRLHPPHRAHGTRPTHRRRVHARHTRRQRHGPLARTHHGRTDRKDHLADFDYSPPAPPRSAHSHGRGAPRPPRPAPTPTRFGKNRLAPRRRK